MSILNTKNVEVQHHWYRLGNRVAWWDSRVKLWTTYLIDENRHQITLAEYAPNRESFVEQESKNFFDEAYCARDEMDIFWDKFAFPEGV